MEPLTQNVTELEFSHGERVFIARTGAKNVVTMEGSVRGGWSTLPRSKAETACMAAELLDAGTLKKGKDAIREPLALRGASLSFSSGVDRTFFSGSCFPEDVSFLLSVVAECLAGASFPSAEIVRAKERALGEFAEAKTDTRRQAAGALSRLLYTSGHVNYAQTLETRAKGTRLVTRADLTSFRNTLGKDGLVLSIVGDVVPSEVHRNVERMLAKLPSKGIQDIPERHNAKVQHAEETFISIPDKANIDVYMGMSVPLTFESPEYLSFLTLGSMLGGRGLSTGHLMRTIRERDGYTYGIYSQPDGFTEHTHGMFRIWATFSPAIFEKAVAATKKEMSWFFKNGITEAALETKKDEMAGGYQVGLATTHGLASMLHKIGVEGKPLSYLDEYPSLIRTLSLKDVMNIVPLLPVSKLSLAAAGTKAV